MKSDRLDRAVRKEYGDHRAWKANFELYLAREPLPPDEPVYVFQHTQKTGGTSVRALIYYNVSPTARYRALELEKGRTDYEEVYREAYYSDLTDEERSRLTWAISHQAGYLIPLIERPVFAVTIVREPVDRTISRLSFGRARTHWEKADALAKLRSFYEVGPLEDAEVGAPSYDVLIDEVNGLSAGYANPQSRWLLAPLYDVRTLPITMGPPPKADMWRERLFTLLDETYDALLVQDRLDESVSLLAGRLDWPVTALPKMRENKDRPRLEQVDAELHELICAYNWLDVELYRYAVARADRAAAESVA
jgi:hypothetical protein